MYKDPSALGLYWVTRDDGLVNLGILPVLKVSSINDPPTAGVIRVINVSGWISLVVALKRKSTSTHQDTIPCNF